MVVGEAVTEPSRPPYGGLFRFSALLIGYPDRSKPMRSALMRLIAAAGIVLIASVSGSSFSKAQTANDPAAEWPSYGGDAGGSRYSPLGQITRENVSRLKVAWTYRTLLAQGRPAFRIQFADVKDVEVTAERRVLFHFRSNENRELPLLVGGLPVLPEIIFTANQAPAPADFIAKLGEAMIIKPVAEGSSVGLHRIANAAELAAALRGLGPGRWMAEPWVRGREVSVGVLAGRALGVVEIRPKDGASYDFEHK